VGDVARDDRCAVPARCQLNAGRRSSRRYFTTLARRAVPKTAGLADRTTFNPTVARFDPPAPENTGGAPWTALYRACSLAVSI